MSWWPLANKNDGGKNQKCDECGKDIGLSRDDRGRIYCPDHRHLHDR